MPLPLTLSELTRCRENLSDEELKVGGLGERRMHKKEAKSMQRFGRKT